MRIRRVIVTKTENLTEPKALAQQQSVRSCWRLPWACVLFEFYHPVFDQIYDTDGQSATMARREAMVKAQTEEAVRLERGLMEPLYKEIENPSEATMLLLPTKGAGYYFLGRQKNSVSWPEIGLSSDLEGPQKLRILGRLAAPNARKVDLVVAVLREWSEAMISFGVIDRMDAPVFTSERFTCECRFSKLGTDAAVALYSILTETRPETSVEAVGVFSPTDFSSPFLQIGGPGRSEQWR